ncbi:SLBB domain-containing protein [bacterium]|nr:SLBB domain-containing protein [bacterium]
MRKLYVIILLLILAGIGYAQIQEDENSKDIKQKSVPMSIDFSKIFDKQDVPRVDYLQQKQQQNAQYVQSLSVQALEKPVDPDLYIVGPGDQFLFVLRGSGQEQVPIEVTPEGYLFIPGVEEIKVSGQTLTQVKETIKEKVKKAYKNSAYSISLLSLRLFRVHVVGEVKYPGTYTGRAIDRVTDMIDRAGGISSNAWYNSVILKHIVSQTIDTLDVLAYEKFGDLSQNPVVEGGDVIYVPTVALSSRIITVEGNFIHAGMYALPRDEDISTFLVKIGALKSTSAPSFIMVYRKNSNQDKNCKFHVFRPFKRSTTDGEQFILKPGDRIVLPSEYVYVKGAVRNPGAYPYVADLTAREYAGMAGGDYRSGKINGISVYHTLTGKREKGPDTPVYPGDVIHMQENIRLRLDVLLRLIPTLTSLILAAKAAGFFDK